MTVCDAVSLYVVRGVTDCHGASRLAMTLCDAISLYVIARRPSGRRGNLVLLTKEKGGGVAVVVYRSNSPVQSMIPPNSYTLV